MGHAVLSRLNRFCSVVVALSALIVHPFAIAQAQTPEVTINILGLVENLDLPGTVTIAMVRGSGDPGAVFTQDPNDPSAAISLVETGTLSAVVNEETWTIFKGGRLDAAQTIQKGERAVIESGDVYYIPGNVTGDIRVDGTEQAEVISFVIGSPEAVPEMTGPQ